MPETLHWKQCYFKKEKEEGFIWLHSIPKNFAIEINYEIHDKELIAIVDLFKNCATCLKGASHQVTIYTDHKNLEYFMKALVVNHCQTCWNMSLSRFDFVIRYQPIKQQRLFDAFSRQSYLAPKKGEASYE